MTTATLRRHKWIDELCGLLGRIVTGRAAADVLEDADDLPTTGLAGLALLPVWGWAHARIDVGRKDRIIGSDARLLLPVRFSWEPGAVAVLADGETYNVTFSAAGMGHNLAGTTTLDASMSQGALLPDGSLDVPARVGVELVPARTLLVRLEALVADGEIALWQALSMLEPKVKWELEKATSHVSAETGTVRQRALDDITVDTILTKMMYGEPGTAQTSTLHRLVDRCLAPATFAKVDPERYVAYSLSRDAKAEVRRAINDPHIGPKIRALADEIGQVPVDELIQEYRQRYPADRLSIGRAMAALTVRPSVNSSTFELRDEDHITESAEESVINRLSEGWTGQEGSTQ